MNIVIQLTPVSVRVCVAPQFEKFLLVTRPCPAFE